MKNAAILAAAASLAALSAPAYAAEATHSPAMQANTHLLAFDRAAGLGDPDYEDDDWDDDDRRRGRRYRDHDRYGDDRRYDDDDRYERRDRRLSRRDRVWRGRDGRYYCKRGDGTTGLVIGAGVGALLGRTVDTRGDRTVGTLLGALAGGLLGREIDRGELRCR